MRQFLVDSDPGPDGLLTLRGKDYRYLVQVLRLAPGDRLEIRLPNGILSPARLESLDRGGKAALIRLEGSVATGSGGPGHAISPQAGVSMSAPSTVSADFPTIILFQWILKGPKMDQVLRQATEAGVSLIVPVLGDRCLAADSGGVGQAKTERWERIVREARQQSGSAVPTRVWDTVAPDALGPLWAERAGEDHGGTEPVAITLTEAPLARKTLHEYLCTRPRTVALAIGPEGGMTAGEVERLRRAGFNAVHFRTNILRAETAALYGIAAVQTLLLESDKWRLPE